MIAKIFFVFELLVLLGCGSIMLLIETFDSMAVLIERAQSVSMLLPVVYLRIPNIIQEILPFSLVISAMLTLAKLYQSREYITMLLSGKSPLYIFIPIHILTFLFSVMGFIFEESVTVKTNTSLQKYLIEKLQYYGQDFRYYSEPKQWFKNKEVFFHVRENSSESASLSNVVRFSLQQGNLQKYTVIDKMWYDNEQWKSKNSRTIHFYQNKKILISSKPEPIKENQTFFAVENEIPTHLDIFELKKIIQQRKSNGYSTISHEALLIQKITFPFSGSVLVFFIFSLIKFFRIQWNISYAIGASAASIFLFGFLFNFISMGAAQGVVPLWLCWVFFPFFILVGVCCEYKYHYIH